MMAMLRVRARAWMVRALIVLLRWLPRRPAGPLQRILVIEPGHLGDVLLLTPALTALRTALPAAQITVLVGPWARTLLARNPAVDAVLTCPFPGFVRGERGRFWQPYLLLLRYAALLRAGRFDAAIVARDDHWWGGLLALAAGVPQRVGAAYPLLEPALSSALPFDQQAHVTQQRLDLVAALTHRPAGAPHTVFVPAPADGAWAAQWLAQHNAPARLVAVQPGSGGPAKLWPAQRWTRLIAQLATTADIVITGGPADMDTVAEITALLDAQAIPYQVLVGATSLGQLAALFQRCALVIGVDNGPLHIAVAQGVPTLQLFGPGSAQRFGPWGAAQRHRVLRAELWCAPCGVLSHCPRGTNPSECMTLITVAAVVQSAQQLLAAHQGLV